MQFARINDVTIHYQIIGAPADRPVIVFTNSLGTDFRIWRDVVVRLAGDFAIVLYDKRGHGLSDVGQLPHRSRTMRRILPACSICCQSRMPSSAASPSAASSPSRSITAGRTWSAR